MSDSDIEKTKVEDVAMEAEEEGVEKRAPTKRELRRARTICNYWLVGKCKKGESCPYRHTKDETVDIPVCKYMINGKCNKGEECPFSHDMKRVKCQYFKYGNCDKGDECPFNHDFEPLPVKFAKRAAEKSVEEVEADTTEKQTKKAKVDESNKKKQKKQNRKKAAKNQPTEVVEIPNLSEEERAKFEKKN